MIMPARRLLALLACVVALGFAGNARAGSTSFRSPSRNIACVVDPGYARCDIHTHDWKAPRQPKSCELDWGGGLFINRKASRGEIECAGDTLLGYGRRLQYGRKVRRGGITCISLRSGVKCRNAAGHGFLLSREAYRLF